MRGSNKNRRIMDEVSQFTTLLGPKTRFVGNLTGGDNCIVYGQVKGDCQCEGVLVLGEHGQWQGNIQAPSVIISGHVDGDIEVSTKLELTGSARVNGSISSPIVAMEKGAVHAGEMRMGKQTDIIHFSEKRGAGRNDDNESDDKT